jgi:hypothetical protein
VWNISPKTWTWFHELNYLAGEGFKPKHNLAKIGKLCKEAVAKKG